MNTKTAITLGLFIAIGLFSLGYSLGSSIIKFKSFERIVSVKGLAQKEVKADTVIWPIIYLRASNDLSQLYTDLETDAQNIQSFLRTKGFSSDEITLRAPNVIDKVGQEYGGNTKVQYRYSATQILTVYTNKVDLTRKSMIDITQLGKKGTVFRTDTYNNKVEFMFTGLNNIKPQMIQESTRNARASAQKFAEDSKSQLGKIRKARQGQFSITSRDKNTPYIKRIRVVSTIEYYLSD